MSAVLSHRNVLWSEVTALYLPETWACCLEGSRLRTAWRAQGSAVEAALLLCNREAGCK